MATKKKQQQRNRQLFKLIREGDIPSLLEFVKVNYAENEWERELQEKSGDSVVHVATKHGHLALLHCLVDRGLSVLVANHDGKMALHDAAQFGQTDCLRYLIENKTPVDCLKRADWTPLMLACTKDLLETVEILVMAGANLRLKNKDGWNCFHIACREGHNAIVNYLLDQATSLWNETSKNGRTPIHTVALHGHVEVMRSLILRGEYPSDPQDSCGSTPFMDALRNGHLSIANLLLSQHQADIHKTDNLGRSAVHLAAQVGCVESVRYLVCQHNMDVNIRVTTTGATPLHLAAKEGQHEMVSVLCSLGADVQHTDLKGRTPLHQACGGGFVHCVRALLDYGASDVADLSGCSARSLSQSPGIRCLLDEDILDKDTGTS